jgi:hypothetical protein
MDQEQSDQTGLVSLDLARSLDALEEPVVSKLKAEAAKTEAMHQPHADQSIFESKVQESYVFDLAEDGRLEISHIQAAQGGQILLTQEARNLLRDKKSAQDILIATKEQGLNAFRNFGKAYPERSVDPVEVVRNPAFGQQERVRLDQSPSFRSCSTARSGFSRRIEDIVYGDYFRPGDTIANDAQNYQNAIAAFDQSCLEVVKPGPVDSQGLPLKLIGVLERANGQAFCMAGYLGKGTFITARHCREIGGANVFVSLADGSKFRMPLAYIDENLGSGGGTGSDDVVRFRVASLARDTLAQPLGFAQPTAGNSLRVIGYFAYADPATTFRDGSLPKWTDALRATRMHGVNSCRVIDVTPPSRDGGLGCIQHSCQAFKGFSGSPMLVKNGSQWMLVGIHTGTNDSSRSCTAGYSGRNGSGYLQNIGNLGVRIPTAAQS